MEPTDLIASANRAMWGHITPNMRAVSLDFKEETAMIFVKYVFDEEPTEEEVDLTYTIGSEIIADFRKPWRIHEAIEVVPYPHDFADLEVLVYARCEEDWLMD